MLGMSSSPDRETPYVHVYLRGAKLVDGKMALLIQQVSVWKDQDNPFSIMEKNQIISKAKCL